ncbi:Uncharacterised protein [Serratia quinivorans]|uniref:Uncharacterized protein n=1 Tax=Serratia quinivorans TaxID=137545 RepID=A0A379Z9C0_9GAMM|nr:MULTISPECIES: hypothetical protein [Serratia]CAI1802519.1 Uncharacterised protein [Serratia quinivorans]CAI1825136.1 Uncharacterised protein [Serratia quinivorans]CAI1864639.1 Uncharacterised protein [Serratia quinivorans]CAI1938522.1 Uncharacterised protein [Serratia quinivorans]SUI57706.1 Uncharacterised protein [Serratia quinivorans]
MMRSGRRRAKLTSLFTEPSQPHATAPDRNRTPQPPLAAALVALCGIVTGVVGMGLV